MEPINAFTGMSTIGELKPKLRKSDFTIQRPQTLFEPDWKKALAQGVCPWCFNKLKEMKGVFLSCRGVKHKKAFVIRKTEAERIINNQNNV